MPPYFSLTLQRKADCLPDNYVERMYAAVVGFGCPFKSEYWFQKGATYQEIIAWNQAKLQQGLKLGSNVPDEDKYMQILFDSPYYSHMRGLWVVTDSDIDFEIIVPEEDILDCDGGGEERENRIAFMRTLAVKIWETGLVHAIQTHFECDYFYDVHKVLSGENVSTRPFAIIPKDALGKYKSKYFDDMIDVDSNGVLIEKDKNLWDLFPRVCDRQHAHRRPRHF